MGTCGLHNTETFRLCPSVLEIWETNEFSAARYLPPTPVESAGSQAEVWGAGEESG